MRPKISEKQVLEVAGWVGAYIAEQRTSFRNQASPIGPEHQRALELFFPLDLLRSVRVIRKRPANPPFYAQLQAMGIQNAPSFSDMAGVTFQDLVMHVEALSMPLLFHELVHAVQYRHLGLEGFAERYVRGFLSGGSYEAIPLEKQAYELEARFVAGQTAPFSVDGEVENSLRMQLL
jgi:hypothetical protein